MGNPEVVHVWCYTGSWAPGMRIGAGRWDARVKPWRRNWQDFGAWPVSWGSGEGRWF